MPATLHVGEVASMEIPLNHDAVGSAGNSLSLMSERKRQGTTLRLYRAVAPGKQTLIEAPREPTPDGCVSCATVHYFVTVVP